MATLQGAVDADFGFTGHYIHLASGLHLAPFRAYNAGLGRWLSRDAIGERGDMNLYGYVGNSPNTVTDPLGLSAAIVYRNGGVVTVYNGRDLIDALQNSDPGSVQSIIFPDGHGNSAVQGIDDANPPANSLQANSAGKVMAIDNNANPLKIFGDFSAQANRALAKGGTIQYYGCNVAKGSNNLAQTTSASVPNATVIATPQNVENSVDMRLGDPGKLIPGTYGHTFNVGPQMFVWGWIPGAFVSYSSGKQLP